ncbi:hypothetical protein ABZ619_39640 [Streptomyces sp. NPDC007851]|uniref:hypothetical protein n=1 Tax=Streptomyces sp. NPDC007851 TaxID=3155008 RepID=UPI0033E5D4F7
MRWTLVRGRRRSNYHCPPHPHGCLGAQGALTTGDSRNNGHCCIQEWFQRAIDEGDLPPQTHPGLLARYLTTSAYGVAVQAASGVDRDELRELADAALRDWPHVRGTPGVCSSTTREGA